MLGIQFEIFSSLVPSKLLKINMDFFQPLHNHDEYYLNLFYPYNNSLKTVNFFCSIRLWPSRGFDEESRADEKFYRAGQRNQNPSGTHAVQQG